MRHRPSARLLVLDADGRLLLFRFVHESGALAGQAFWATPGGALDAGEGFEQAAHRELGEETGFEAPELAGPVASRRFTMRLPDGEEVQSDERFFVVRVPSRAPAPSRAGWTALEREVMRAHRWWTRDELATTAETVWPDDLPRILRDAGV